MVPTSISQVIEQVVNAVISVAASFAFMHWFANRETPAAYGAAGGTWVPFPALAAFVFLTLLMFVYRRQNTKALRKPQADRLESWSHVYTALFLTLTPIILSQFVYQLSGSVDNSMFGFLMSGKGLTEKERLSLLGIYGGKYRLLSNVPVAVASSGNFHDPEYCALPRPENRTDVMYKIRLTIKFNMLIAIPCAFGMAALASPVLRLIFRDSRDLTRNLLMLGAPAVIFFSLSTVTNAVLQGIDLMRKSVTHSAISLVVHAALVYVMLKYLNWGVYGLVIGNVTFALVVCVMNWHAIGKALRYRQEVKTTFLLPCICAAVMGVIAFLVYALVNKVTGYYQIGLLISIPVAMVVYGLLIVLTRAVTAEELPDMPFGMRILRLCRKFLNVSQYRIFYFHALPSPRSALPTAQIRWPAPSAAPCSPHPVADEGIVCLVAEPGSCLHPALIAGCQPSDNLGEGSNGID